MLLRFIWDECWADGWEARYRGPLLSTEVDLGQPPVPSLILESAGPASCPPTSRPRSVNHSFDKVRRSWRVVTSSGCPSDCMSFPLLSCGARSCWCSPSFLLPRWSSSCFHPNPSRHKNLNAACQKLGRAPGSSVDARNES